MISEWMENGNVNEFTEKDRRANRTELVCRQSISVGPRLICSVGRCREWIDVYAASSLGPWRPERGGFPLSEIPTYLSLVYQGEHLGQSGPSCLHRGLRTFNYHRCQDSFCYQEFRHRISLITPPNDSLVSFTPGWSTRWVSPELLDPGRFGVPESEDDRPTRESDCYAMGMVIYEVSFYADKAVEVFNRGPGIMWTRPIPSHSTGCCGHRGDLERGSTEETR